MQLSRKIHTRHWLSLQDPNPINPTDRRKRKTEIAIFTFYQLKGHVKGIFILATISHFSAKEIHILFFIPLLKKSWHENYGAGAMAQQLGACINLVNELNSFSGTQIEQLSTTCNSNSRDPAAQVFGPPQATAPWACTPTQTQRDVHG